MAKRSRWILIALVTVFGLPFVAAWVLVLNPQWLPVARANHGQLIRPPVPTSLTGAWTLLVPTADECDAECKRVQSVALIVRRALGPEGSQVETPPDCRDGAREACAAVRAAVGADAALVVVDPRGNAMLRYGPEVMPRDLLQDVQRLLKSSRYRGFDGHQ